MTSSDNIIRVVWPPPGMVPLKIGKHGDSWIKKCGVCDTVFRMPMESRQMTIDGSVYVQNKSQKDIDR